MKQTHSKRAFKAAKYVISGGVNSPIRAQNGGADGPIFIQKGAGTTVWDVDGNAYTDYCLSWGALITGHAHPTVLEAVTKAMSDGTSFGAPTLLETALAERIVQALPSVEQVRFVNSGTEAVMTAIRLARGVTGKHKIIKCEGCYHGHADYLLVTAGSGVAHLPKAASAGVPPDFVKHTISVPYNDAQAIEAVLQNKSHDTAAIILEPVAANMGVVLPKKGYLETVRRLADRYGVLLIFDEVITGFRVAYGGAQSYFDAVPDITCLGKIIGGGFPVGAVGASEKIMAHLAPQGTVYQAGTLSGNPVAMAAGIATLDILAQPDVYDQLAAKTDALLSHLLPTVHAVALGALFCVFFTQQSTVSSLSDVQTCNMDAFRAFHRHMLARSIYLSCLQYETQFVSLAHTDHDIIALAQSINQF